MKENEEKTIYMDIGGIIPPGTSIENIKKNLKIEIHLLGDKPKKRNKC
jgi:hypothetical protein